MKIGFSSSICPDWDLQTLTQQAQTLGYDALELRRPAQGREASAWSALADAAGAKRLIADAGLELTCLATDFAFHWPDRAMVQEQQNGLRKVVETAGKVGCPCVSIKAGSVPRFANRDGVLLRIVAALRDSAVHAAEHRVIILVENDGTLGSSRDLWFILDAVGHPSVACCWSPYRSAVAGEPSGVTVPRIGRKVLLTRLADAVFSSDGRPERHVPLGEGHVDLSRYVMLMHGIGNGTRMVVDWPCPTSPPNAQEVLAKSLAWIKAQLDGITATPELTAYKGDKNAPRYAPRSPRATVHG